MRSMEWIVASTLVFGAALGCDDAGTGGSDVGGSGSGGSAEGGSGGAGDASTSSSSATSSQSSSGSGVTCTQARLEALHPIDEVSEGVVTTLSTTGDVAQLFIDASAGGITQQTSNPWIYVSLGDRARVDLTDPVADTSTAWDIAFKRPILRANVGDGGPAGIGGSFRVGKAFDAVTAADLSGVVFASEVWFDADCTLKVDPTGAISTAFDGWYDYDDMVVTPGAGTWLIRSGDGARFFKLAVESYYSTPEGGEGMAGGRYRLRVAELDP